MFALQWFGTLVSSFLNFAPQWCVLQFLRILERRQDHQPLGLDAWIWVIWIGLSILAQSWVESWVFWISWSSLCVPVRAQLSSLIFQKSMRRKDVKEASKKSAPQPDSAEPMVSRTAGASDSVDRPDTDETDKDVLHRVRHLA